MLLTELSRLMKIIGQNLIYIDDISYNRDGLGSFLDGSGIKHVLILSKLPGMLFILLAKYVCTLL